MEKLFKIFLLLLSAVAFIGAFIYKIYALNFLGTSLTVVLSILFVTIIVYFNKKINTKKDLQNILAKHKLSDYIFVFISLLILLTCFKLLFTSATESSIISPWEKIPPRFFVFYGLSCLVILLNIIYKKPLSLLLLSLQYGLSLGVAVIVYKINYGFDPFVHSASLELIAQNGFITPKPFYYLGYYSLIIITHKLFFISTAVLNKVAVPVLASAIIPYAIYINLKKWFDSTTKIKLLILTLLILPFNFLIISTPQNITYIFIILVTLFGLNCKNYFDLVLIFSLSVAALSIHPIAGIPAIIFSFLILIHHLDNQKIKKYLYSIFFIFSAITLPLAFLTLNHNSIKNNLSKLDLFSSFIFPHQENIILNTVYLYIQNITYLLTVILIAGVIISWKHRKKCKIFFNYLLISTSLFVSYLFVKFQSFDFLIQYERSSYADRVLLISFLFSVPLIYIAFYNLITRIYQQKLFTQTIIIIFFPVWSTIALYSSYPRLDNYHNSHGVSVGNYDIEAVQWIENNANDDFIVLANQQISAASLNQFGFKKYFNIKGKQVFYYPIPTGEKLYDFFLDMVYKKPSRETMLNAMKYADVNTGYFVLNKYWWGFEKILNEAKIEADSFIKIGNGEVYIFKYSNS